MDTQAGLVQKRKPAGASVRADQAQGGLWLISPGEIWQQESGDWRLQLPLVARNTLAYLRLSRIDGKMEKKKEGGREMEEEKRKKGRGKDKRWVGSEMDEDEGREREMRSEGEEQAWGEKRTLGRQPRAQPEVLAHRPLQAMQSTVTQ